MFVYHNVLKGRSVQNIVWPPIQDEPDLPTASPLYFPPPSQVARQDTLKIKEFLNELTVSDKNYEDCCTQFINSRITATEEVSEVNEIDKILTMEPKMSICSAEVTSITGRRSATECIETITDTLGTQILVESIMQKRPKSPPPIDADVAIATANKTSTKNESSSNTVVTHENKIDDSLTIIISGDTRKLKRPASYNPTTTDSQANKVDAKDFNSVPQKWESPMVSALTIVPEKTASTDQFAQIPTKRSMTALASALAVAPAAPFTPAPTSTLEPVPLPEETEPYFPPEHPIIPVDTDKPQKKVETKRKSDTPFLKALQIAPERPYSPVAEKPVRKKKQPEDALLRDLPKPERKLTMREALATAPETPYPVVISEITVKFGNPILYAQEETEKKVESSQVLQKPLKPAELPPSFQSPVINAAKPYVSSFPPVSDKLLSTTCKTDYSEIKSEISSQIVQQSNLSEKQVCAAGESASSRTESSEESVSKMQSCETKSQVCEKQTFIHSAVEKQLENTIYKKPLPLAQCLHSAERLPQYQVNLSENAEMELLLMEKLQSAKNVSSTSVLKKQSLQESAVETVVPNSAPKKPLITVQAGDVQNAPSQTFRPVVEDKRSSSVTSTPRPRSLTPSMINKPAPTLPYYQSNLVAQEHLAPESNLFDPKSPAVSRSPSPCCDRRSISPFRADTRRSKSPAAGPPPNPLLATQTKHASQNVEKQEARKNLMGFIPQYKEKRDVMENIQAQNVQCNFSAGQAASSQNTQQMMLQNHTIGKEQHHMPQIRECAAECATREKQFSSSCNHQGAVLTKLTASSDAQHSQHLQKTDSNTTETSADGSVQIQRKRTITEEVEHSHKSQFIQIEKNATSSRQQSFRNINAAATEEFFEHGLAGLHVTNPQPIVSPFISAEKGSAPKSASVEQTRQYKLTSGQPINQLSHTASGFSTNAIKPLPQTNFASPKPNVNQKPIAPSQNATPSSTQCVSRPNVPIPNAGVGGGRQAGAIGVAPKRGRGILNVAALTGSRIPLCGHCHSHIRYMGL